MSNTVASSTTTVYVGGGGNVAKLGTASTDTIGLYGVTPVAQAAAITAVSTSAPVTGAAGSTYGFTSTQATAIITAINSLITANKNIGVTL